MTSAKKLQARADESRVRTGHEHWFGDTCGLDTTNAGHVEELLALMDTWPGTTLLSRMAAAREAGLQDQDSL